MKQIIIQTQKEFNKIKDNFEGEILIKDTKESLCINRGFNSAYISVYDNATIKSVYGNATIESVSSNATIKSVYGNATIKSVYGNATIEYVSGNATIKYVYDNATILLMTGLASLVLLYSAKLVVAKGMNLIRQIGVKKIDLQLSKSVNFIHIKDTIENKPNFNMYKKLYPVDEKGKKIISYKAVHKVDGKYIADYDKKTEYKIGEIKEIPTNPLNEESCSYGIHLSHKLWAINFGKWKDVALLECETDIKDIVIAKDCDGKFRTSKIKVIREVPREEW